jgi:hypothetical protein
MSLTLGADWDQHRARFSVAVDVLCARSGRRNERIRQCYYGDRPRDRSTCAGPAIRARSTRADQKAIDMGAERATSTVVSVVVVGPNPQAHAKARRNGLLGADRCRRDARKEPMADHGPVSLSNGAAATRDAVAAGDTGRVGCSRPDRADHLPALAGSGVPQPQPDRSAGVLDGRLRRPRGCVRRRRRCHDPSDPSDAGIDPQSG